MANETIETGEQFSARMARVFETASLWALILTLAWAPFPLGSNRPWSSNLLVFLIGCSWTLFLVPALIRPREYIRHLRPIVPPLLLAASALLWAFVQTLPFVPPSWIHPIWVLAGAELHGVGQGRISLNPWATQESLVRLCAYTAAFVLTVMLCARSSRAFLLLRSIIAIGAFYGLYALVFSSNGMRQVELFYDSTPFGARIAAPFVLHNSLSTYMGLGLLCACALFFAMGAQRVLTGHGARRLLLTVIGYVTGPGMLPFLCSALFFAVLVASGSRAGFAAALVGLLCLSLLSARLARKKTTLGLAVLGAAALLSIGFILLASAGDTLQAGFHTLAESGTDQFRLTLWDAAERMISDGSILGLGLNSFLDAYPFYAFEVHPYVMDKAHNDYLELAAGLGLPAALALWAAILWIALICVRGVFTRGRNRVYALIGAAATALVAFHSIFDFSLQIPAIALSYAVILGLGAAQSFSRREA